MPLSRRSASLAAGASAPAAPLSVLDSFRIGNSGTVYCSAQSVATDQALTGMFDTGYSITCRDAALPVGKLYKLRDPQAGAAAPRGNPRFDQPIALQPRKVQIAEPRSSRGDRLPHQGRGRRLPRLSAGAGQAALRRRGPRRVRQRASARASEHRRRPAGQGRNLDRDDGRRRSRQPSPGCRPERSIRRSALAEAYRRNNAGSYAEAAEFFAAVSNLGEGAAQPLRGAGQRGAAEVEPRPLRRGGFAVRAAPRSSSATTRSSLGGCATIERSTSSTRATRTPRSRSSTSRCPRPPMMASATEAGVPVISAVAAKRLNSETKLGQQLAGDTDELFRPRRRRSSTARRCSCAERRCA